MKKINFRALTVVSAISGVVLIGSMTAWAGGPPAPTTSFSGVDQTNVGIGLRFEFGDNVAEVVGTVRHTYTDTNNAVTGGRVEVAIPLSEKLHYGPKFRAMGLVGSPSVQGEAGIGYDFANQQPLIGIGIQGPYVEGGANYLFNGQLNPYLGVNTFGNAPSRNTIVTQPPPAPN